jgi:hypothetical protein
MRWMGFRARRMRYSEKLRLSDDVPPLYQDRAVGPSTMPLTLQEKVRPAKPLRRRRQERELR